jgi:hypothetical protein
VNNIEKRMRKVRVDAFLNVLYHKYPRVTEEDHDDHLPFLFPMLPEERADAHSQLTLTFTE